MSFYSPDSCPDMISLKEKAVWGKSPDLEVSPEGKSKPKDGTGKGAQRQQRRTAAASLLYKEIETDSWVSLSKEGERMEDTRG